jgi:hypothetical protein
MLDYPDVDNSIWCKCDIGQAILKRVTEIIRDDMSRIMKVA